MTNIVKAIEKEKEYLSYRMKNEEPFHLADAIKEIGYTDLDEYFQAKKAYERELIKFEIIEKSPEHCLTEGWRLVKERIAGAFFMDITDTIVFVNNSKPYNKEYCKKNNLTVYELPTGGGTIVAGQGDLAIDLCIPETFGYSRSNILDALVRIISKHETDVTTDGNDILIAGKKVCGVTEFRFNSMILFVMFFSFSNNSELIDIICHQNVVPKKIPSCMTKLNSKVLKEEIVEWLQAHLY